MRPTPAGTDGQVRPTLSGSERLRIPAVARRVLADAVLVALPDPHRPVERLTGNGADVWALLERGLSPDEAAAELSTRTGEDIERVRTDVLVFANALVARGLAEPA